MNTYTFFWRSGEVDVLGGESPDTALNNAGYGGGALGALDFFGEGNLVEKYEWDISKKLWESIDLKSLMRKKTNSNSLFVGQKLWLLDLDRKNYFNVVEPKEVTIGSMGSKYFELEGNNSTKFSIGTLKSQNESKNRCYLKITDIEDEERFEEKLRELKFFFSGYRKGSLSLAQIEAISDIIKKKPKEK